MMGAVPGGPLAAALGRLRGGGELAVAAIGGSLTTGYAAPRPAEEGWFGLLGRWFGEKAALSGGTARMRNRGLSGTDSLWANFRIDSHAEGADIVFLEFAVNDQWLDPTIRRPAFEALLRRLLSSARPPAVIALFLCEKAGSARGMAAEQEPIVRHYGLPSVDFGAWMEKRAEAGRGNWELLYDGGETIHPNAAGHRAFADCLIEFLEASWSRASTSASAPPRGACRLPDPLYSSDFAHAELFDSGKALEIRSEGWAKGGDRHGEWEALGGCPSGWRCATEGAVLELALRGRVVGVLFSESDAYRDLEAWVDDQPPVTLNCAVEGRKGYLGWGSRILARALDEGEHFLRVRLKPGGREGRSACLVAAFAAGVLPESTRLPPLPPFRFRSVPVRDPAFRYTGRFAPARPDEPLAMCWQGSSMECEFEGRAIAFTMRGLKGRNWMNVEVDGLTRITEVPGGRELRWESGELGPGRHRVRLYKRSEGFFGSLSVVAAELDGRLIALPPRPGLRLEFYGDSITAGACVLDADIDQYDDLAPHDAAQSYAALASRELGAEYVGIAVSGTGITCSWNPVFLPAVYDLSEPLPGAPRGDFSPEAPGGGEPDIVIVNLGQNDYGFPRSKGEPFSSEFALRYADFLRKLRRLRPGSWIVCAIGGMTAYSESPELRQAFSSAVEELRKEDGMLSVLVFKAAAPMHPRADVQALLARELVEHLRAAALPRIGKPGRVSG